MAGALIRRADESGIGAFRCYGSSEHPTISSGRPEDPPTFCGASINDKATGMFTVIGALGALRRREITGRGGLVDTSLFETAVLLDAAGVRRWSTAP